MGSTPGVFPVSNGSNDLTTALNSTDRIYSGVGKIDYHLNDKNSLSGMFFMSPGSGAFVDDPGHQVLAYQETTQYARSIVGSVGWTYVPNSNWVNSFRFGLSHYYQTFISGDSTVDPTTYGIFTGVTNPASFGFPRTPNQGLWFLPVRGELAQDGRAGQRLAIQRQHLLFARQPLVQIRR